MENNNYCYLRFPVQILQEPFKNKDFMGHKIFYYGIINHMVYNQIGLTESEYENLLDTLECYSYGILDESISYFKDRFETAMNVYTEIDDSLENKVFSNLKLEWILDFISGEKTDFEIAVFRAVVAFKSILGTKAYVKFTNEYLLCRMFGYGSIKDVPNEVDFAYRIYSKRYQLDKIKSKLESFSFTFYGKNMRGCYVCLTKKLDFAKLVLIAESNRKSAKEKRLKTERERIIAEVKKRLN